MLNQEEDVKITENYHNCTLKIFLWLFRQSGNDLIADIVMKFTFTRRNNEASMKRRIESILHQMPNTSEDFGITPIQLIRKYHFFTYHFISVYPSTSSNSCFYLMRDSFFPELNFVKTTYYEVKCNT